ncbi:MAG: phenylphosphate carboxylase subunit delta [Candidimonas sp.]|nr:MAG: phenylphosphate carboxylase subunit delta [Candidimonas sp.]
MDDTPRITHPAEAMILAKISPAILERLRAVRLMAFDVDGVLTDGSLWYGENGEMLKRFNALDGHGLRLLGESGIVVALVTGREGPIISRRAADLGISIVHQGIRHKSETLEALARESGYGLDRVGYMGDDIVDLPAMQRAGFAASVPGAPAYVSQAAHWVASRGGGAGAVRECCDLILAAQGRLGTILTSNILILGSIDQ